MKLLAEHIEAQLLNTYCSYRFSLIRKVKIKNQTAALHKGVVRVIFLKLEDRWSAREKFQ
jgi:hypothetical protein